ncbi:MAG TPA: zinc metalloprotease [Gemmataceae bacterium]|nr:zinc metalloprotease [Gemmataceae bacterium]
MAKKKPAAERADESPSERVGEPPKLRNCGAMQELMHQLETVPNFRKNQVALEHACRARLRMAPTARTGPYKIPVVVHVIHNLTRPGEKISEAQVKSQIAVLNKDFRGTNPDKSKVPDVFKGLVADANIEFVLATKDPNGNATTGITFTATTKKSFSDRNNPVKAKTTGGANAWNTKKYLNIWVCTLATGPTGQLLGYAQFPGGPTKTDGVVILNTAFGTTGSAAAPFNLGRTTTHEVGHYLNLRHIWGDDGDCSGSDFVDDTPNCETANGGKPTFPKISCSNGPNGDMFMNYMDYTDDDAMFMFTPGQVARMHATLDGPRKALVS